MCFTWKLKSKERKAIHNTSIQPYSGIKQFLLLVKLQKKEMFVRLLLKELSLSTSEV